MTCWHIMLMTNNQLDGLKPPNTIKDSIGIIEKIDRNTSIYSNFQCWRERERYWILWVQRERQIGFYEFREKRRVVDRDIEVYWGLGAQRERLGISGLERYILEVRVLERDIGGQHHRERE